MHTQCTPPSDLRLLSFRENRSLCIGLQKQSKQRETLKDFGVDHAFCEGEEVGVGIVVGEVVRVVGLVVVGGELPMGGTLSGGSFSWNVTCQLRHHLLLKRDTTTTRLSLFPVF